LGIPGPVMWVLNVSIFLAVSSRAVSASLPIKVYTSDARLVWLFRESFSNRLPTVPLRNFMLGLPWQSMELKMVLTWCLWREFSFRPSTSQCQRDLWQLELIEKLNIVLLILSAMMTLLVIDCGNGARMLWRWSMLVEV
jgi:hypothetical protein